MKGGEFETLSHIEAIDKCVELSRKIKRLEKVVEKSRELRNHFWIPRLEERGYLKAKLGTRKYDEALFELDRGEPS